MAYHQQTLAVRGPGIALPQLLALDQLVVLPPQEDLAEVAEVPAVGHNAVVAWHRAGQQGGLYRTRHRGQHGPQRRGVPDLRHVGHVGQQPRGQSDDVDDDDRCHQISLSPSAASRRLIQSSSAAMPSAMSTGPGSTLQV